MNEKYESILYREHYQSKKYKHMPLQDRAAQFGSFAALTGHSDMIREEGRLVDEKIVLSDEQIFDLNDKLNFLCDNIESHPRCTVTYFVPDDKKEGGMYVKEEVIPRVIDLLNRVIKTEDKKEIFVDEIVQLIIEN